ncbi:MAG: hypothetical protein WC441_04880 [Patescibacteria group bacterium]
MKKKILGILLCLCLCLCFVSICFAGDITELVLRGAGGKYFAGVNKDGQLQVDASIQSALAYASTKGDAYSWTTGTANIDATDCALCVINRSRTRYLVISKMYVYTDVPTAIPVYSPAAATWAGTAITGVNLNRTSTLTADALAYRDETGNTQANLVVNLQTNETTTDEFGIDYDFQDSVILGYNQAIAVDLTEESAAFNVTIIGYYVDIE